MRSLLCRRALVALAVGGVVCATLPAVPALGIVGGSAVPADGYGFVANVMVGDAVRGCSGALIDPEWIVTAKSCFAEGSTPVAIGPPPLPTTVTVGRVDLTTVDAGQTRGVIHVVSHPARDLLLAKLAAPVTEVAPVRVSATAPTAGEVLQVAGFGRTATEWVPHRLRTAPFSVKTVDGGAIEIAGDPSAPATICRGDAGGPALRGVATGPELVALHTASWQAGCLDTDASEARTSATETRLDDVRDWVRQTVRGGAFVRLATSATVLDTRSGVGAPAGPRAARSLTPFQVTGVGGVPATGVTAVLVDVTAVTTAATYLTLLPDGAPRPPVSMVNATANQVISNTAVVPVPASGKIAVYSHGPGAHVVVDVQGYYTSSTDTGQGFVPVGPTRIVDTRSGLGGPAGVVPARGTRTFTLTGGAIPAGAGVAYLDLIVVGATGQGWVGAFPPGGANNRSVMDFVPGTTSHGVTVRLDTDGRATFTNNSNSAVHFVLTALGYFGGADTGTRFRTMAAQRLLDTRGTGTGVPVPANGTVDVPLGVPAGTTAAVNLTVVDNKADGHLNVWPVDGAETTMSLVNYAPPADGIRAGHSVVKAGTSGKIRIRNNSPGTAHILVDVQGWYAGDLVPAGGAQAEPVAAAARTTAGDSIVEDFGYPVNFPHQYAGTSGQEDWGTDEAEAKHFELISGNGGLIWVSCTTSAENGVGVIKVFPGLLNGDTEVGEPHLGVTAVCFKVLGPAGYVKLRIPNVFEVQGDSRAPGAGHDVDATVVNVTSGAERTKRVERDESEQFGRTDTTCDQNHADYPDNCRETLLELRVVN
ncbi:trypsin-like serine protease [Nonomuraea mesophila]|uniref:Trypsin-like serine protease n=1 Tax=Nonomuraea mesophila TaxID=2530382 RepID=A0A4R5FEH7_9ACTN|nr:trypsin-like serine protease [Nonomuraea mesophila]TDE47921.1 trypsin-like serine protease [Nonomuraea mesophila]